MVALAQAALASASCAHPITTPTFPALPFFVASISTPDGMAGLARNRGTIELYLPDKAGGVYRATMVRDEPFATTVHLLTLGGETGRAINTFVFGNAPAGAIHANTTMPDAIETVQAGVFLIGLPVKDLDPQLLSWRFLDVGDRVISQGTGLLE